MPERELYLCVRNIRSCNLLALCRVEPNWDPQGSHCGNLGVHLRHLSLLLLWLFAFLYRCLPLPLLFAFSYGLGGGALHQAIRDIVGEAPD